jgi:hypothetical protein|tara:strand:- start:82 stop:246 length:165 start_codon:yes stop_codon:yes gene_type:complete
MMTNRTPQNKEIRDLYRQELTEKCALVVDKNAFWQESYRDLNLRDLREYLTNYP